MGFGKDTQSYIQMKILYTQLVRVTIQKTGFSLKLLGMVLSWYSHQAEEHNIIKSPTWAKSFTLSRWY